MPAVQSRCRQPGEDCPCKRPGDDVTGVVDPGVDARVSDEHREALQGYRGSRQHTADPAREGEGGRRVTRRKRCRDRHPCLPRQGNLIGGTIWAPPAPEGLQDEVHDGSCHANRGQTASSRATTTLSSGRGHDRGCRDPKARVVGGLREPGHRSVESRSRRSRDCGVDGKVDSLGVTKPRESTRCVGVCGGRAQVPVIL